MGPSAAGVQLTYYREFEVPMGFVPKRSEPAPPAASIRDSTKQPFDPRWPLAGNKAEREEAGCESSRGRGDTAQPRDPDHPIRKWHRCPDIGSDRAAKGREDRFI